MIVHEALPPPQRRSNDLVEAALQANQFVFKLNYYGDHPIAKPLNGLDFLTAGSEPIMATAEIPAGVKVTPLLPIPMTPHFWASAISVHSERRSAEGRHVPSYGRSRCGAAIPRHRQYAVGPAVWCGGEKKWRPARGSGKLAVRQQRSGRFAG